jgi:hypothetical protein
MTAALLLVSTNRGTPAATAASSTRRVPATLTSRLSASGPLSAPATCSTAEQPRAAAASPSASARSATATSTPGGSTASARARSRTTARTSRPCWTASSTNALPRKPLAPVTISIRTSWHPRRRRPLADSSPR